MKGREFSQSGYNIGQQIGEYSGAMEDGNLDETEIVRFQKTTKKNNHRESRTSLETWGPSKKLRRHLETGLSEKDLKIMLPKLADGQKEDLSDENRKKLASSDHRVIFAAFKTTKHYKHIMELAKKEFTNVRTDEELDKYKGNFLGKYYQDLAHCIMIAKEYNERKVLYADSTTALFKKLHPRNHFIKNPFDLRGIDRIPVPDGLIIEGEYNTKITGFIESTLCSYNSPEFEVKYRGYRKTIADLSYRYPNVFSKDIKIIFAIPTPISPRINDILPSVKRHEDVEFLLFNFTHNNFRTLVDQDMPTKQRKEI